MLVEERVVYVRDRDNQESGRSAMVQSARMEVEEAKEIRLSQMDLGLEVILNKPDAIRATNDFLNHRDKWIREAEREIELRKIRTEISYNYRNPVTVVEQIADMNNERNMGRNLVIVRNNFNLPNHGRVAPSNSVSQGVKIDWSERNNQQYYIPDRKVA